MWNPIKIHFENLFAHENSTYEFKNNKCVVIFGENRTDRNLENNGAGKTTLFEAICIALTNESLRSIKKETFINRAANECYIEFDLYNPVLKMSLKICRKFYRGNKPVAVRIIENGVENKQIVSVAEANRRVIELIGIGREDLLRYFIISQDNHYTFFTASDAEKKEIMNRITSADMINPVLEELNNRKVEKTEIYNTLSSEIDKLSSRREALVEQRADALNNDDTEEIVRDLEQRIADVDARQERNDKTIIDAKSQISEIENQLKNLAVPDLAYLKIKRSDLRTEIDALEGETTELKRVKRNLESELADTINCPQCGYEFIHKSDLGLSVADAKRLLKETNQELKNKSASSAVKREELNSVTAACREGEATQEKFDELNHSISTLRFKIKARDDENADLESQKIRHKKAIAEARNKQKDSSEVKRIETRIAEVDEALKVRNKALVPVAEELDLIRFWIFRMGRSGFQTYLANKSVKIIEGITNSYLRKFGVDISVLINGFTVLKSGEVREKIDVFISNDGRTAENFMGHSGGERGRVMLAGVLGIQHLINLSLDGKGLNMLILDECFHGMDSRGQENIIKIFERMGITMLVITQNVSESFNNENTLRVVKENNVSRYII